MNSVLKGCYKVVKNPYKSTALKLICLRDEDAVPSLNYVPPLIHVLRALS
jgi:hypothetical protein